jgi:hypothetical protein
MGQKVTETISPISKYFTSTNVPQTPIKVSNFDSYILEIQLL